MGNCNASQNSYLRDYIYEEKNILTQSVNFKIRMGIPKPNGNQTTWLKLDDYDKLYIKQSEIFIRYHFLIIKYTNSDPSKYGFTNNEIMNLITRHIAYCHAKYPNRIDSQIFDDIALNADEINWELNDYEHDDQVKGFDYNEKTRVVEILFKSN